VRIAVVQLMGIGNAILTTPLVAALHSLGHEVTVIADLGRSPLPAFAHWPLLTHVCDRLAPAGARFDLAMWCHPIWDSLDTARSLEGTATIFLEPTTRPNEGAWQARFHKHEVEYMLDMARRFGFSGPTPPLRVFHHPRPVQSRRIAIGIGYLKDGVWDQKHWGNENFRELCQRLQENGFHPVLVGDARDWERDGRIIARDGDVESLCGRPLQEIIDWISGCGAFIGNDTGLMHVAAATGRPVVAIFRTSNPVKNHPWCERYAIVDGNSCDTRSPMLAMMSLIGDSKPRPPEVGG
jgi:heptosyltransferase III